MKPQTNFYFRIILLLFVFAFIATSCEKDKDKSNNKFLVDSELIVSNTPEQVQTKIILASLLYPEIDTLLSTSAFGVEIYKITYKTTFQDNEIIASGIVSVPKDGGNYPIISFQNGTNTCNSNAPSMNIENQLFQLISIVAGNGYIVAIPDYIGFGESNEILHPYHHRESSNRAVIDIINAARELLDKKEILAATNGELFLMGYSQGGWATLSVLNELETNPVAGISPVAASMGAGAYDLYKMGQFIVGSNEYPNPFYLPYFIQSHCANGFMNDDLSTYFNEPYASITPELFDGSRCNSEMNSEYPVSIDSLLTADFITDFETNSKFETLRNELKNNSIAAWNVQVPLLLYHSKGDKSVPWFETEDLYNNLLQKGVTESKINLQLIDDPDMDHSDGVVPWGIETLIWFGTMK